MSFHLWSGLDSGFSHEHIQIAELTTVLENWSAEKNKTVHLLTNFYVDGEEIDAAIILPNSVVVIDLKSGSGNIIGGENGDWICSKSENQQFTLNENRKNPYQQARDKRYAMLGYLESRKSEIFSSQKFDQMSFNHTNSFIVFDGNVQWNKEQLPSKVLGWFDVLSINSITSRLELIKSKPIKVRADNEKGFVNKSLSLSQEETWLIPTLLSLKNEDENISDISIAPDKQETVPDPADKQETVPDTIDYDIKNKKLDLSDISTQKQLKDGEHDIISGVFNDVSSESENVIFIKLDNNEIKKVHINQVFSTSLHLLNKLANESNKIVSKDEIDINLINCNVSKDEIYLSPEYGSLFVIEPEWLINVTALTEFDFCERSLFNNRYSIKEQNEAMVRGSIIHEVFEDILKEQDDKEQLNNALKDSFNKRGLEFALMETDPETMETEFVRPHLNALFKYKKDPLSSVFNAEEIYTERYIINPIIGLKGKIDAVVRNHDGLRAIELKTGKSWGGKVKDGHAFQSQAYSLLMAMKLKDNKVVLDPTVVYSGDYEKVNQMNQGAPEPKFSIGKNAPFKYDEKAHVINLRNSLVLADYLFYLNYSENENKCRNCFQKPICKNIFSLELEHDESNSPLYSITNDDTKFSDQEKSFFYRYNKLLTAEYRVLKESQGEYLMKAHAEREESKKCVKIKNILSLDNNDIILYCQNKSELRESDRCLLSDEKGPIYGECLEVFIKDVSSQNITVRPRAKIGFTPQYLDIHEVETLFERNYSAIYELLNNPNLSKLKSVLFFDYEPNENAPSENKLLSNGFKLKGNQKKAVELSNGISDFLLLQGPPGTGKTSTIAKIVENLYQDNKSIIIGCYTHRAIDEVIRKMGEICPDVNIIKIGPINETDPNKTLSGLIEKETNLKEKIKKAQKIIASKPLFIGTTHSWLSGNFGSLIIDGRCDVGIIDEASQVLLPNLIGVLRLVKKFILVGDHKQLPPVVQSKDAEDLKRTLFEELFERDYKQNNIKVLLDVQYRMPSVISNFISNEFYNGQLTTSPSAERRFLEMDIEENHPIFNIINPEMPLTLVNVKSKMKSIIPRTSSEEAEVVLEILTALFELKVSPDDVGVIAPFRAQVAEIRRKIESNLFSHFEDQNEIRKIVDTVDRFQGDERDVIIFSLTLQDKEIPSILKDVRRLNVAISRARRKFIGIGDWDKIDNHEALANLVKYVKATVGADLISV